MARIPKVIHFLILLGIGALFIYAGALKAADPAGFATEVDRYHLLPWEASVAMALYLPWLEIICGGGLFFQAIRRATLWLLLGLMLVFLGALGSAWIRGIDIRCGCFGSTEIGSSLPLAFLRDLGIVGAVLYLMARDSAPQPTEPRRSDR